MVVGGRGGTCFTLLIAPRSTRTSCMIYQVGLHNIIRMHNMNLSVLTETLTKKVKRLISNAYLVPGMMQNRCVGVSSGSWRFMIVQQLASFLATDGCS